MNLSDEELEQMLAREEELEREYPTSRIFEALNEALLFPEKHSQQLIIELLCKLEATRLTEEEQEIAQDLLFRLSKHFSKEDTSFSFNAFKVTIRKLGRIADQDKFLPYALSMLQSKVLPPRFIRMVLVGLNYNLHRKIPDASTSSHPELTQTVEEFVSTPRDDNVLRIEAFIVAVLLGTDIDTGSLKRGRKIVLDELTETERYWGPGTDRFRSNLKRVINELRE